MLALISIILISEGIFVANFCCILEQNYDISITVLAGNNKIR